MDLWQMPPRVFAARDENEREVIGARHQNRNANGAFHVGSALPVGAYEGTVA